MATCDMCAAEGVCEYQDDGSTACGDCLAFHESALTAAAEAAWGSLPSSVQQYYDEERDRWRRLCAEVVKGYLEYTDEGPELVGR